MSDIQSLIAGFSQIIGQNGGGGAENYNHQAVFRQLFSLGKNPVIFAKSMFFGAINIAD